MSAEHLVPHVEDVTAEVRSYDNYRGVADFFLENFVEDFEVVVGRDVFERAAREEGRLMICANHGPPHTPLVGMSAVSRCMIEAGRGDRRPLAVTFRALYSVPVFRELAAWLTQLPGPYRLDEIVRYFEEREFTDLCLAPEGQNSIFGDPAEIREFTSPRFVELAVRLEAPILLSVAVGMEAWARKIPMPDLSMMDPIVRRISHTLADSLPEQHTLCLPISFEKIPTLRHGFALYRPGFSLADLEGLGGWERKALIREEADRVREAMTALYRDVRDGAPREATTEPEPEREAEPTPEPRPHAAHRVSARRRK